jgi:transcription termination/antitermination protein NusG
MFRWYVINTYSGHENKVKANLEHRIESMGQRPRFRRVVVPTEQVIETKDGQKVQAEKPVPLSQPEVDRILHTGTGGIAPTRAQVEFSLGESVKITSGPLADFDGEITDVNADAQKLQVMVNIFERQVPVEVGFDNVKKLD